MPFLYEKSIQRVTLVSILHWGRMCSMPNFSPVSSEGIFHDCERGKHIGAFFKCVLWHLWAFFLGVRRDDTVLSVARLPVEFRIGRDDMGNVCCQLKKVCFCAEWMRCKLPTITPRRRNRFHAPHRVHTRRTGKNRSKMLCHSLGLSPHA